MSHSIVAENVISIKAGLVETDGRFRAYNLITTTTGAVEASSQTVRALVAEIKALGRRLVEGHAGGHSRLYRVAAAAPAQPQSDPSPAPVRPQSAPTQVAPEPAPVLAVTEDGTAILRCHLLQKGGETEIMAVYRRPSLGRFTAIHDRAGLVVAAPRGVRVSKLPAQIVAQALAGPVAHTPPPPPAFLPHDETTAKRPQAELDRGYMTNGQRRVARRPGGWRLS